MKRTLDPFKVTFHLININVRWRCILAEIEDVKSFRFILHTSTLARFPFTSLETFLVGFRCWLKDTFVRVEGMQLFGGFFVIAKKHFLCFVGLRNHLAWNSFMSSYFNSFLSSNRHLPRLTKPIILVWKKWNVDLTQRRSLHVSDQIGCTTARRSVMRGVFREGIY